MNTDILAFGGLPGFWEMIVILLIFPFACILPAVVFWKICAKAGFPGVLGLLMFVPVANVILPLYIAFAEWPALRDKGQSHQ